jgi:ATP-dependent DNA helicase RecQ
MSPAALLSSDASADPARDTLRRVFGHAEFRGRQRAVIDHVLAGGDGLAVLPTGGGKSVCYQIPALLRPGVGVVVSPLIALMADQVANLRAAGVNATRLDSSLTSEERARVLRDLAEGALDLIHVSPEGLFAGATLERLQGAPVSILAIDEAHCVSQWGHDFRPDYRRLGQLADMFPGVPRLAVTATADGRTRADIREQLRLTGAPEFVASFDRPNLALSSERKDGRGTDRVTQLVKARRGLSGIVYVTARDSTEALAEALRRESIDALAYHALLPPEVKAERLRRFQEDDAVVMVATIAFGMGIDKPDVRFVIHADPPKCIEAYWQEVGRAGRDGEPAEAIALYAYSDKRLQAERIETSSAPDAVKAVQLKKLAQLFGFLDAMACRRAAVRRYFGEEDVTACGMCDACLSPGAGHDATRWGQMAVSAVVRCEERFGRRRIVNHLTGAEPDGPLESAFAGRSTFGIGKALPKTGWRQVLDQLCFEGVLEEDRNDGLPLLRVACPDKSRALLRGEARLMTRDDPALTRRAKASGRKGRAPAATVDPADESLFAQLRRWRLDVAREARVPPYVIFHDATLNAIAQARPSSLDALLAVQGVGEAKARRFGEDVLGVVRAAG